MEVVGVTEELILAGVVREWVERAMPGQPAAQAAATDLALRSYAGGASVAEALEEVKTFVACWARHPANRPAGPGPLRIAS
ncbi:MAG TPA: hypothetical protein VFO65_09685 [Acidimicrobiales bacterium]|nr:hypothetical protein [Acidimicrobiales bacterium]